MAAAALWLMTRACWTLRACAYNDAARGVPAALAAMAKMEIEKVVQDPPDHRMQTHTLRVSTVCAHSHVGTNWRKAGWCVEDTTRKCNAVDSSLSGMANFVTYMWKLSCESVLWSGSPALAYSG